MDRFHWIRRKMATVGKYPSAQHLEQLFKALGDAWIFPSFSSIHLLAPYQDVKKSFQTAMRKAGIKDFKFHDLRHTFASQLVMARVDIPTVKGF